MRIQEVALLLAAGVLGLTFSACRKCDSCAVTDPYFSQSSEDNVLHNFQAAWRGREIQEYAKLLATDFRYIPDTNTRRQLGIESWDREAESLRVACLFRDPDIKKITMDLSWPARSADPAGFAAPRDVWTKLFLTDVFLDVDVEPVGSPLTTYRIEDQTQRIFFRKGRTWPPSGPADTLTYIVEWRDEGTGATKPTAAVEPSTWSKIKLLGDCLPLPAPTRPGQLPQ